MEFVTRYRQPSLIDPQASLVLVFMASTELVEERQTRVAVPTIFSGRIAQPLIFRNLLLGLRQTVESRFYRPDWWRLLDPVITSGSQLLRLECFSSCASVYARADLTGSAFEDAAFDRDGTTNVDFNSAFLNHLAQLRPGKPAHFEMGEQSIRLQSPQGEAVEHKVKLPERWIKGFLQVQAVHRQARPLFEMDRLTAGQLLARIPAQTKGALFLVPKRHKPEILHRQPAGGDGFIAVTDAHRLRLLHAILPDVQVLRVYQTEATGASLWVADTGAAQFTLGLSGAAAHGFSGDGDALRQLRAVEIDEVDLALARAAAQSLNHFTIAELAGHQDFPLPYATEIVDRLAQQGVLGFDRDRDRYFYRQLPFMLDAGKRPGRLLNSGALLAKQAVEVVQHERRDGQLIASGWVRGDSGRFDLPAVVDAIQQRAVERPADPLLRRRLAFLEGYLATGQCGELAATVPDHSSALSPADFALHETAEALALDIAHTQRRVFTQADYERIFAGILRFPQSAHSGRVGAILTPVLEKSGEWQQGSLAGSGWWGRGAELSALFLAWAWRGETPPRFPKDSLGGQLLDSQFRPALRRRLKQVSALLAAGHDTLLSTPTHGAGWLTPAVFADRFTAFPVHLVDAEDLGAALYRLPGFPDQRADAWRRLTPALGQLDAPLADALILALAPDLEAEPALDRWLRRFEKHPPTEPVIHVLSGEPASGGLGGLLETFRIKIFQHDPNAAENVAFRLFNAALRCRFGLNDAGIAGRAPRLLERLSATRGWSNERLRAPQQNSALLVELLFAPRPLTETLFEQQSGGSFPYYPGEETSHPLLWPYLLADPHYFAAPNLVTDQSFRFPPLAQRLFEAGLCRQGRKDDYYRDVTRSLLEQGKLPQVEIRPHLDRIARGLLATQTPQREACVDLLLHGLRDGRVTPTDLAGMLTGQIRDTEQGFAQLDQALASLGATGEAGRATMALALEQVIGDGVAAFSPRKLSLVLDRLAGSLDETRRAVHDPAARRELEQLAEAKKKSIARDKASILLARTGPVDQPPLHIMAVAALAVE